ncbi:MAG: hypothetical protein HGB19_03295, partial [Chlorobiales bacterium]|nr:hypothetical protein [Chlorobiales bacterium]
FSTSREFSGDGTNRDLYSAQGISEGNLSEFSLNFHYENGITSWITLVADLGYRTLSATYVDLLVRPTDPSRNKTVKASAFSDLWLSGRVKLLKFKTSVGPLVTGFQGGIKIPTGDATIDIPVGTGYTDAEGLLLADLGFELFDSDAYLRGLFGYRARGGGYASQRPYTAEFGIAVARELRLHASFSGVMSGGGFSYPVGMDENRLITLVGDEAYSQISVGLVFAFSETLSISFDYFNKISGKSSMAGDAYLIGVEFR